MSNSSKGSGEPQQPRDSRGRFTSMSKCTTPGFSAPTTNAVQPTQPSPPVSGLYVRLIGGDENMYLISLFRAFNTFLVEDVKGQLHTELRLTEKIKAARLLFGNDRQPLRGGNIKIYSNGTDEF